MLTTRYIVRLIQAFINRFKAIIVIGVALGFIIFLIIVIFLPSINATVTRIGVVGRFTANNLPDDITKLISRGLTKIDNSGQVSPDLAKSWETPDSGKTWLFSLNDNLTWQDKAKLTTDEINYEFSDATVEKIDKYTLKFNLNSNFSAFPVILAKPIFKKGLIGAGDWKVKKLSLIGGLIQKLTIQSKNGEIRTYKFYPTEERVKLSFKLGEVDQIMGLYNLKPFDTWKSVNITNNINYNNFVGIFFNSEDEKLSEKSVRQALNYAIDKDIWSSTRSLGPISPLSWSYNPQVKEYKKELSKTKEAKDMTIKLSTLPNLLDTAEIIKKEWEAIGVKTEIEVTSTIPSNYEAFLATVDIPKDPDQYSLWHSTQTGTNISRYKNARIDKLLEDGRTELSQDARKKVYLDFQRFLVEDSPAIFLYHPTLYTVTRK